MYGVISFFICLLGLGIPIQALFTAAFDPTSFVEYFYAYMFWSVPALIILVVLHLILCKVSDRMNGMSGEYSMGEFFETLAFDITNPIRGLFSLVGAHKSIDDTGLYVMLGLR